MSESVRPRVIGTETEYNPTFISHDGSHHNLQDSELSLPDDVYHIGSFLTNGGRFYTWKQIPEYCTAESISFADVVYGEEAGDIFMVNAMQRYIEQHDNISRGSLHKRTATTAFYQGESDEMLGPITSWGYHENYLTPRRTFSSTSMRNLVKAHLLTRNLLVGSGFWWPTAEDPTNVLPSQKLTDVVTEASTDTIASKPILNARDEPHADNSEWARLHVTSVDTNNTPWSGWLKLGSTSLVLRLGETGFGEKVRHLMPEDFVLAASQMAWLGSAAMLTNRRGKTMRGIELQEVLAATSHDLSEVIELPAEEKLVLEEWGAAIEDFKKDPELLAGRTEWIARRQWLRAVADRTSSSDIVATLRTADKLWDKVFPLADASTSQRGGIALKKRRSMAFPGYDPEAHLSLVTDAPKGTRAADRAEYIRSRHTQRGTNYVVDWASWGGHRDIDPYAATPEADMTDTAQAREDLQTA